MEMTCPKTMTFGPCGGVDFDGRCEVGEHRCVFVDTPVVRWNGKPAPERHTRSATGMLRLLRSRQIVVADFPARALDVASIEECAAVLTGTVDAVLAGDSGAARVQFPPSYRAHLITQAGLPVWTGFNNRDRNRVALEGELAALAEVGVVGVHCVTGDHTLTGHRQDAQPVFDLDSTQTAALARSFGHLVSVGESPMTPPADKRAARLREKENAGAEVCFVNHCGGADAVSRFVQEARDLGSTSHMIACVPLVVDRESAALLRSFPTLVLPEGFIDRILYAADPRREGIMAAIELSEAMLAINGVSGVNLSGGAGPGAEIACAEAMATVSAALSR